MDGEHSYFTSSNGMGVFISLPNMAFFWLLTLCSYSFGEATWEREEDMGLPNPGFFIEKFETQAKKEKVELSQCNHQAVLLKCAVGAGWNTQGVFVQKEI